MDVGFIKMSNSVILNIHPKLGFILEQDGDDGYLSYIRNINCYGWGQSEEEAIRNYFSMADDIIEINERKKGFISDQMKQELVEIKLISGTKK